MSPRLSTATMLLVWWRSGEALLAAGDDVLQHQYQRATALSVGTPGSDDLLHEERNGGPSEREPGKRVLPAHG